MTVAAVAEATAIAATVRAAPVRTTTVRTTTGEVVAAARIVAAVSLRRRHLGAPAVAAIPAALAGIDDRRRLRGGGLSLAALEAIASEAVTLETRLAPRRAGRLTAGGLLVMEIAARGRALRRTGRGRALMVLATAGWAAGMAAPGWRRGLSGGMALRLGLLAAALVIAVLGQRRPARTGEQDDGQGGCR